MKAVILALALSCAGAFAPVNKAAVRAPVELEAKKSVADLSEADLKGKKVRAQPTLPVVVVHHRAHTHWMGKVGPCVRRVGRLSSIVTRTSRRDSRRCSCAAT